MSLFTDNTFADQSIVFNMGNEGGDRLIGDYWMMW